MRLLGNHPRQSVLSIALMCLLGDQWLKHLLRNTLPVGNSIPLIASILHITHVQNTGTAFSLFSQYPLLVLIMGSLLLMVLGGYVAVRKQMAVLEVIAYGFIMGGALGNLWDRFTQGSVTDYIDVRWIHYPVFNLADSLIFFGIGLIIWHSLRLPPTEPPKNNCS